MLGDLRGERPLSQITRLALSSSPSRFFISSSSSLRLTQQEFRADYNRAPADYRPLATPRLLHYRFVLGVEFKKKKKKERKLRNIIVNGATGRLAVIHFQSADIMHERAQFVCDLLIYPIVRPVYI